MTILNLSAAARACGIDRKTLYRAIKSGRLSSTTAATGERGIDVAELIRVFGPLKGTPQVPDDDPVAIPHSAPLQGGADATLVEVLLEQLQDARERERVAVERERIAQEEKARLLDLLQTAQQVLQTEQQTRRDLEQKLLPAPTPQPELPRRHHRLWILLMILIAAIAALVWTRGSAWWPLD